MRKITKSLLISGLLSIFSQPVLAQNTSAPSGSSLSNEELDIVELELEKSAPKRKKDIPTQSQTAPNDSPSAYVDLNRLQGFNEVSIIQKRFFPKTGRFQLAGQGTFVTNDAFFNTVGANIHLGYFFSEVWGLEFDYLGLSSGPANAAKDLQAIENIQTDSLVSAKSYVGANIVMVPIYGKMTWFNEKIIPYDLFFTIGAGSTKTESQNVSTLHLGTGQLFAMSKSLAFRWDFSWNFFTATDIAGSKGSFNSLYLSAGLSYFFPEAKYR